MHVVVDLWFGGFSWKNCVEESFKLLAGASFLLAYLQPVMTRRKDHATSLSGLRSVAFFGVSLLAGFVLFVGRVVGNHDLGAC